MCHRQTKRLLCVLGDVVPQRFHGHDLMVQRCESVVGLDPFPRTVFYFWRKRINFQGCRVIHRAGVGPDTPPVLQHERLQSEWIVWVCGCPSKLKVSYVTAISRWSKAPMGLGFNRSMQHTRNCVSRRSVANEAKTKDSLLGKSESANVGALARR